MKHLLLLSTLLLLLAHQACAKTCPSGEYWDQLQCKPCPAGTFLDGNVCQSCAAGSYTPILRSLACEPGNSKTAETKGVKEGSRTRRSFLFINICRLKRKLLILLLCTMFHYRKKVSGEKISRRSKKKAALRTSVSRGVLFIFLVALVFDEGDAEVIDDGWEYDEESIATSIDECQIDETKCDVKDPSWIRDGICDGGLYNTIECCFDGGDCIDFNDNYPNCTVADPYYNGDGECDGGEYNTVECGWDGGDCIEFNTKYPNCTVDYPYYIGDGKCDGGEYNTEECKWDGGDCIDFNEKYPNCTVDNPSWIGDGYCDVGAYNTVECRWDGGDCNFLNSPSSVVSGTRQPSFSPSFSPTTVINECQIDETKCKAWDPYYIGDGICHGGLYNTIECCFDGGDCIGFNIKYPNCSVYWTPYIGDGRCHGWIYNTEACKWDGGDCIEFNDKYPNCTVDDPHDIGDGECNRGEYNTEECGWDGGDCFVDGYPECHVDYPDQIGNGRCNLGEYNTEECGFDGGDCIDFNEKYPDCSVNESEKIGNDNCDGGEYNTEECAWDGGDCIVVGYPNCRVDYPDRIGNGDCDGGNYNTVECGWDWGDCIDFNEKYPKCAVEYPSLIGDGICREEYNTLECEWDGGDCNCSTYNYTACHVGDVYSFGIGRIANGICDGGDYNTIVCCFDGGDCIDFDRKYPNCQVDFTNLIGNGICNKGDYNTEECGWDGGDCIGLNEKYPNCNVGMLYLIGDGTCHTYYNTEACGWDGGDCIGFNDKYRNCKVHTLEWIGDGICDGGAYNTEECVWDGGDCNAPTSPFYPSASLPPSFSPTTVLSNSLYRSKQNQESYIACIDTASEFRENEWMDIIDIYSSNVHDLARVASFEEAREHCKRQKFDYMVFTCPTKGGTRKNFNDETDDRTFGFQVWCGNDEELRISKKVEASECRSNLIGQDPNERSIEHNLCDGPNYHEKDGIWLGVAGRGAVYSVNYELEKEKLRRKYERCLGIKENEWRDKGNDGCAWYEANPTKRCFIDDDLFRNHQCGNAAKHICSSCINALSQQFRTDHMEDTMKVNVQTSANTKIDINGDSSHAIVVARKQTGYFATIFELNQTSAGIDMIPKFDISPEFDVSSVAISANGSHTAIGGFEILRVYQETEQGNLIQKGSDIAIEEGLSVVDLSINREGNALAFTALDYTERDFHNLAVNHVAIYRWDQNSAKWNEEFRSRKSIPKTIDMDRDGKRVVISYLFNGSDGYEQVTKLLQYKIENSSWEEEERFHGHFGKISGNGRRIMTFFALNEKNTEVYIYEDNGGDGNWSRVGDVIEIPKEDNYVASINYRGNRFSVKVKRRVLVYIIDVYEFTDKSWERVLSINEGLSVKSAALEFDGLNMIRLVKSKNGAFIDVINLWKKKCPEPIQTCAAGVLRFSLNDCSSDCMKCSTGKIFNSIIGSCVDCPVGTYLYQESENRQAQCKPCPEGLSTYGVGSPSLNFCRSECTFPVQSEEFGTEDCNKCTKGFYSPVAFEGSDYRTNKTTDLCKPCPANTACEIGTSLSSLRLDQGFWRDSNITEKLYRCTFPELCIGGNSSNYCKVGHEGPLCEQCSSNSTHRYFNASDGTCNDCRIENLLIVVAAIILSIMFVAVIILQLLKKRIKRITRIVSSLNLPAKLKIFVTFYQILSSLDSVYSVQVDESLLGALNFMNFFSLDVLNLFPFPMECIGGKVLEYVLHATWPIILCLVIAAFLRVVPCTKRRMRVDIVQLTTLIFYFTLPIVTQSLFHARKCEAYITSDSTLDSPMKEKEYLIFSKSIICNAEEFGNGERDQDYVTLEILFIIFFVLWPVLIFGYFAILLFRTKSSIMRQKPSELANKCRFLWTDFDENTSIAIYWDLIDFLRKLFLVGFVNFLPLKSMLRLTVAVIVSIVYLTTLAIVKPYKRTDDFKLAIMSSVLLASSFSVSFSLAVCNDSAEDGNCRNFIGLPNKLAASWFVFTLALSMLVIMIVVLLASARSTNKSLQLKATGYQANLELPSSCDYHIFMSHVWSTGQDKCHAIARKLQLYLPDLKLWLDVDQLDDIAKLEEYIERSAVILIFYSEGYLKSRNCRREFLHALSLRKPIIVVYDGDDSQIQLMRARCDEIFTVEKIIAVGYDREEALQLELAIKTFALTHKNLNQSIQWLKVSAFSTESLKLIYMKMLMSLPRAQDQIYRTQLLTGLYLPEEIQPIHTIPFRLEIIVNKNDKNALSLAKEIRELNKIKVQISSCEVLRVDAVNLEEGALLRSAGECRSLKLSSGRFSEVNELMHVILDEETNLDMEHDKSSKLDEPVKAMNLEATALTEIFKKESNTVEKNQEPLLKKQELPSDDRLDTKIGTRSCSNSNIPKVFLLYLNKETFDDENRALMTESIIETKKENIPIILVHEQDLTKEASPDFSYFFQHTPQELIDSPINLYNEIAIPLYTRKEYRQISLHFIVEKIKSSLHMDEEKNANCWSDRL